ncbi:MAG TPA: glycerophosphodiester phosphodiesterase family protein [Phycisphaerae bacterium]|nr:glycerophosphodiester phosphodiesterase family protein [Phycisphaerae bacterium]
MGIFTLARDHADLARLGGVTRARLTQIIRSIACNSNIVDLRFRSMKPNWLAPAVLLIGIVVGCAGPTGAVLGYINDIPPESTEARAQRHSLVAVRRAGLPIIVHRGISRLAPENTLEACAAAMDCGADGIEIDIRRSRDGVLYLFHDDDLERLTSATGPVSRLSYYELLRVTPKNVYGPATRETRPPTLAAALALARDRVALLHLDIKEPGIQDDIAAMLDQADVWDHVVEINDYNSDRIRSDARLKLMPYKGWVPEDADLPTIRAFLDAAQRQHQMAICDDPRPAVAALGRALPDSRAYAPELRAWWSATGAEATVRSRPPDRSGR